MAHHRPLALLLTAAVGLLYGGSLGYGLIWDDPTWFRQGEGMSLAQLFAGSEKYQFYRPLTLFYLILWRGPGGTVDAVSLHAVQIACHLVSALLCFDLARLWGRDALVASLGAVLFTVFPFSQQAVAWAATQQPLVTVLLLGSVVGFVRGLRRRSRLLGLVSIVQFTMALFVQESAAPLCLLFVLLARLDRTRGRPAVAWSLAFPAVTAIYAWIWMSVPRLPGIASVAFEPQVAAYLLQAVAFPVARVLAVLATPEAIGVTGAGGSTDLPFLPLLAIFGATWIGIVMVLWRAGEGRLAGLASVWIGLTLLSAWAALAYDYIEVGPRVAYPAVPGIAMLWGSLAAVGLRASRTKAVRAVVAVAVGIILAVCVRDVQAQDRLFAVGAAHVDAAIRAQAVGDRDAVPGAGRASGGKAVFVNFPDRYRLRHPPFPLGYWGLTLAPVATDLADFARMTTGRSTATESWSVPAVGADDRAAWPYEVDMRGVIVGPAELLAAAASAEGVYLSDYRPDGSLGLTRVGALIDAPRPGVDPDPGPPLAAFVGGPALVHAALVAPPGAPASVHLVWEAGATLAPEDTVFVHAFDAAGRQVLGIDGDAWGGLLPLHAWPAGAHVEDVRPIDAAALPPGEHRFTVGLYNRATGRRFEAIDPRTGRAFADGEVPVGRMDADYPSPPTPSPMPNGRGGGSKEHRDSGRRGAPDATHAY